MPKQIAFLRAINVGGHLVKMDALRQMFEALGYAQVETFLASGNVIFEAGTTASAALEQTLEQKLRESLGYEVAVFLRTPAEVAGIIAPLPFSAAELETAEALNLAFLKQPLTPEAIQTLKALETEIDRFEARGREIYWLCRRKQSDSTFSNAVLERKLGQKATLRGLKTLQKLTAKYPSEAET